MQQKDDEVGSDEFQVYFKDSVSMVQLYRLAALRLSAEKDILQAFAVFLYTPQTTFNTSSFCGCQSIWTDTPVSL